MASSSSSSSQFPPSLLRFSLYFNVFVWMRGEGTWVLRKVYISHKNACNDHSNIINNDNNYSILRQHEFWWFYCVFYCCNWRNDMLFYFSPDSHLIPLNGTGEFFFLDWREEKVYLCVMGFSMCFRILFTPDFLEWLAVELTLNLSFTFILLLSCLFRFSMNVCPKRPCLLLPLLILISLL